MVAADVVFGRYGCCCKSCLISYIGSCQECAGENAVGRGGSHSGAATDRAGWAGTAGNITSDRFDNWAVINKALEPIAERRGKQLHDALLASACSGATVEARVLPKVLVRAKFLYLCDPSQAAWNFNNDNGPARDHYFADLDALSKDGAGFCIDHAQVCNISDHWLGQLGRRITSLIAGLSCRPYSTANHQRNSGTQDHSESHLFEAFLREAKRLNVLEAWFENVLGLLIRESKTEPQAPIRRNPRQGQRDRARIRRRHLFRRLRPFQRPDSQEGIHPPSPF